MKKYYIVEDYYKKESNTVFKLHYTTEPSCEDELFNSLGEVRKYCKENDITKYRISNDKKSIYHYWIEEREVNEDNEIISDHYDYYAITADAYGKVLILDFNTDRYELTDDIFGYDNRYKVAEKLFRQNLDDSDFYIWDMDTAIDGRILYNDEEIIETYNAEEMIRLLKELNAYDRIIDKYTSNLKEVKFIL